jgi:pimeloyl-ACP methyl ester carboxylesterase
VRARPTALCHARRSTSKFSGVLLGLALASALGACGGAQGNARPVVPTASPSPTATLAVASQSVHFTTADGVSLAGTLYGHGSRAVILSNEGNNASDPWRPIAQQLAFHGYLVLSYAYRPSDANYDGLAKHALTDLRAAIAFMRARPLPITRLILIGASLGALVSLKAATTTRCDGLIAISAPMGYQDVQLSNADLQRLLIPKLFVTSAANQPFASDTLHMFDVSPQPKDKRVYPGDAHGTSLFTSGSGADLLSTLLAFVGRYAPMTSE